MCVSKENAPWQETFTDAGDGDIFFARICCSDACDGDEGDHLGPCWVHFKTLLGHLTQTNYVFQPKTNFLEMAHTNLVSSIR